MAQINLPTLDTPPVKYVDWNPEMKNWISNLIDYLNILFSQIFIAQSDNLGGHGTGPLTVSVANLTTISVVVASIISSSNPVSIISVVPGNNAFTITFSGDPGANAYISYIAIIQPLGG